MNVRAITPDERALFARGRRVYVPAGTTVQSMHPRRPRSEPIKRGRWVTAHSTCDGISQSVIYGLRSEADRAVFRRRYPNVDAEAVFRHFDDLMAEAEACTDASERLRCHEAIRAIRVYTTPPQLTWAGAGGYWCSCPLQDLLP